MALGIKKITESVIEDGRSLVTIGDYTPPRYLGTSDDIIDRIKDNNAIDNGALFTATTIDRVGNQAGVIRMKVGLDQQARIDAEKSLSFGSISADLIADKTITNSKIANSAIDTQHIKDKSVTASKLANGIINSNLLQDHSILNRHLNAPNAADNARTVWEHNIKDGSITTSKLANNAVTSIKIADSAVNASNIKDGAVSFNKLSTDLQTRIKNLEQEVVNLNNSISKITNSTNSVLNNLEQAMKDLEASLKNQIASELEKFKNQYQLNKVVVHDGARSVGKNYGGTELINLHCTGDIQGRRVYYMTYQDLAEAYMPGEFLRPGDIVAMKEDGLVYKAESTDSCIVGVISNEFANCLGATIDEINNGWKVAVGTIGKVHVKVKGPVKLGQQINVSLSEPGIGYATNAIHGIGKALETIDCDFDEINSVLVQIRPM